MISSLSGVVEALGDGWAIINVGGVGFQVFMPSSDLSNLGTGGTRVKVFTHLHVREDNLALSGFLSPDGLALFEILLSVSGVGPRLALAMLSAMEAERLAMALAGGDASLLMTVPGIGRKTADRLILELKDKIGAFGMRVPISGAAPENSEVIAALTSLGYSTAEAGRAVASLPASSKLSLEEKIRRALAYFGAK